MKTTKHKMYNLEYWIGNRLIETVRFNIPYGLCVSLSKSLAKRQQYKLGKFVKQPN